MATKERGGRPRAGITYEQIQAEFAAGVTNLGDIARKYKVSRDTIERRVKEHKSGAKSKRHNSAKKAKNAEPRQSLYARAILSERSKKADWSATRDDCIEDLRRIQKEHPDSF